MFASEALREIDPSKLLESVRRCHVNLGHPAQERFLHMLRSAGASDSAITAPKGLKCSVCEAKRSVPSHPVRKS